MGSLQDPTLVCVEIGHSSKMVFCFALPLAANLRQQGRKCPEVLLCHRSTFQFLPASPSRCSGIVRGIALSMPRPANLGRPPQRGTRRLANWGGSSNWCFAPRSVQEETVAVLGDLRGFGETHGGHAEMRGFAARDFSTTCPWWRRCCASLSHKTWARIWAWRWFLCLFRVPFLGIHLWDPIQTHPARSCWTCIEGAVFAVHQIVAAPVHPIDAGGCEHHLMSCVTLLEPPLLPATHLPVFLLQLFHTTDTHKSLG